MREWFSKLILRTLATALAITLAIVLLPYARDWIASILPRGKFERVSILLSRKVENADDLVTLRCTDTGIMAAETNALFIGTVQQVNVPYSYEIGFGIPLKEITFDAVEDGVCVSLPLIRMLYDSFQVTGEPKVSDFWYPLTEQRYQKMLDEQAAACQAEYLSNDAIIDQAWNATCKALEDLFSQWAGDNISFTFIASTENE